MDLIIKKTIKTMIVGVLAMAVLVFGAPNAFAATTLNNDPQDYDTLRVGNITDNPGTSNASWSTSVSADANEVISLAIYYHNTGGETANNLRVRLTPQSTGVGNTQTFTAYVWADNAPQVSGSATVNLSTSQSLSYISNSVSWGPNQQLTGSATLPNGQNGTEVFTSGGLLLGNIATGWPAQGNITFNFQVSGTGGSQLPTVTTNPADTVSQNYAVINGYVDPQNTTDTSRWFEWSTDSGSLYNSTTKLGQGINASSFSETLTGLSSDTTYYFRAVAKNSSGTAYGGVQSFRTADGGGGSQRPFVSTNNATNISSTNATLNCYVNPYNTSDTTRWFEWGTTQSFGNRTNTLNHGSTATNASDTIYGLSNNTTYYFRCVAQNSSGTSYGNVLSFFTGTGGGNTPTAVTNSATNIDQDSARLNGLGLNLGNVSSEGWFEWGTSQSLGNTSSRIALGAVTSNSFYQSLFGLSPNTTYYFRAVVQNTNGIDRGSILSFRTNSIVVLPPPGPKNIRDADITKTVENLDSPNGSDTDIRAMRGEKVRFTIEARNTGNLTLQNVEIKDRVPHFLEFANADEINVNNPQREVVWFVGDLRPGARESVTLDMIVTEDARFGDVIENVAQLESKRVTRTSNETKIRVTDEISGNANNAAAGVFFGESFFPTTLLGWLMLIILILLFLILARTLYGYYGKKKEV